MKDWPNLTQLYQFLMKCVLRRAANRGFSSSDRHIGPLGQHLTCLPALHMLSDPINLPVVPAKSPFLKEETGPKIHASVSNWLFPNLQTRFFHFGACRCFKALPISKPLITGCCRPADRLGDQIYRYSTTNFRKTTGQDKQQGKSQI